jgi:hypothetical protein
LRWRDDHKFQVNRATDDTGQGLPDEWGQAMGQPVLSGAAFDPDEVGLAGLDTGQARIS